jgi:hypothetical protein
VGVDAQRSLLARDVVDGDTQLRNPAWDRLRRREKTSATGRRQRELSAATTAAAAAAASHRILFAAL